MRNEEANVIFKVSLPQNFARKGIMELGKKFQTVKIQVPHNHQSQQEFRFGQRTWSQGT